jgi:riboflavin synthase
MGDIAINELKKIKAKLKIIRRTVPGIKDLPVECKILLEKEKCDVVMALGMVGGAPIDTQCAHEASIGIQHAKLMTNKHIIEVFVHENEAWSEKEFFEICNNRIRKHVHNAIALVLNPQKLIENAGKGIRQGKEDEGEIKLDKDEIAIGVVVSEFNREITSKMEEAALRYANEKNIEVKSIIRVPGAYDIPLAVKKLLMDKKIGGVVALGAIIKGETKHDELIAHATANALTQLSLEFKKPVTLGIIGPGASWEQADARKNAYAERAVEAVIKLIERIRC